MPPGPRQERSLRTRERILAATVDVLVEEGYARLTMQRVQSQAGVTRGALTHHFASMRELAVAAIDYVADNQASEIRSATANPGGDSVIDIVMDIIHRPTYVAGLELWATARTDDEMREALIPGARRLRQQVRQALAPLVVHLREDQIDVLVDGLLALLRGLGLGNVLRDRPTLDHDVLTTWLETFGIPGRPAATRADSR